MADEKVADKHDSWTSKPLEYSMKKAEVQKEFLAPAEKDYGFKLYYFQLN